MTIEILKTNDYKTPVASGFIVNRPNVEVREEIGVTDLKCYRSIVKYGEIFQIRLGKPS
jgi:hypothetical protein